MWTAQTRQTALKYHQSRIKLFFWKKKKKVRLRKQYIEPLKNKKTTFLSLSCVWDCSLPLLQSIVTVAQLMPKHWNLAFETKPPSTHTPSLSRVLKSVSVSTVQFETLNTQKYRSGDRSHLLCRANDDDE